MASSDTFGRPSVRPSVLAGPTLISPLDDDTELWMRTGTPLGEMDRFLCSVWLLVAWQESSVTGIRWASPAPPLIPSPSPGGRDFAELFTEQQGEEERRGGTDGRTDGH